MATVAAAFLLTVAFGPFVALLIYGFRQGLAEYNHRKLLESEGFRLVTAYRGRASYVQVHKNEVVEAGQSVAQNGQFSGTSEFAETGYAEEWKPTGPSHWLSFGAGREHLTDGELLQLRQELGDELTLLEQASDLFLLQLDDRGLVLCEEALEGIRAKFGDGNGHWLEAVLLIDLARFAHANSDYTERERLLKLSSDIIDQLVNSEWKFFLHSRKYHWLECLYTRHSRAMHATK